MRSLFLPLPLLLAPLATPLIFTSAAEAQVGPSCCVTEAEHHPGEPPHPRNLLPYLLGAKVTSPDERALKASAEVPITADAPLVNAIGVLLDEEERRGVSEPERVRIIEPPLSRVDANGPSAPVTDNPNTLPCCQAEAESEPPHPENPPPVLVAAKVKSPDERALQAAAEALIEKAIQLINTIGIPLSAQRGVSEPAMRPVPIAQAAGADDHGEPWRWLDTLRANAAVVLALLLVIAIGFTLSARRRKPQPEPFPSLGELPRPDAAPVPQFEPEVMKAKARHAEREREHA